MLGMGLTPYGVGRAVDRLIAKDTAGLLTWAGVLLAMALAAAAGSIMRHRCDVSARLGVNFRTMQLVTRQATRLGARLDREVATGEIVAIGTTDIQQTGALIEALARGISSAITIVTIAVLMLISSVPVGLLVLVGVPLLLFGSGPLLRPLHARADARRNAQADLTERAVDIVAGLRVLRGIGGEAVFGARYRRDSEVVRDAGIGVARIESILNAFEVLLPGLLTLWSTS
jgi:ABC-type multidrug transport system fused ATPase/permease subunit